jgi:hypothetical protein
VDIATERTTAATDFVLGLLAMGCGGYVHRFKAVDPWKTSLWTWMFGLVALGSLFGAAAHGFMMSRAVNHLLWQPLYLALGLAVGLFLVGAVYDGWGRARAKQVLPFMVAAGIGFFVLTRIVPESFLVFVVYEAFALCFALAVYGRMALARRFPGSAWNAAAVLIMIIAAAVQANQSMVLHLIWPFDHNGIFHLIQMVGLGILTAGLAMGLRISPRDS